MLVSEKLGEGCRDLSSMAREPTRVLQVLQLDRKSEMEISVDGRDEQSFFGCQLPMQLMIRLCPDLAQAASLPQGWG